FPPRPLTKRLIHTIVKGFTAASDPKNLMEAGCTVCGQLKPLKHLISKDDSQVDFKVLYK
ncbi:hypothetical protein GALMADRAFT_50324, partial [Galerina marginata CBS 339.88]